jgi:small subunit ribosomal protein S6
MPSYETLCILHPELPETRVKELTAWMQKILEGAQGTVVRVDEWGMRDLGFRLKKQRRGYYVRVEHEASPIALKELERNLRLSEDVLRFLSVRCTATPAPTPTPASSPAVSAAPSAETSGEEQQ